jgi:hypothetical protein
MSGYRLSRTGYARYILKHVYSHKRVALLPYPEGKCLTLYHAGATVNQEIARRISEIAGKYKGENDAMSIMQ